jgi:hypothetical protein
MNGDTKYIAYLLLENQYMKVNNIDTLPSNELLLVHKDFFPDDWGISYGIDEKIKLLSTSLKEKKNLCTVVDELHDKNSKNRVT